MTKGHIKLSRMQGLLNSYSELSDIISMEFMIKLLAYVAWVCVDAKTSARL